jgi:hypothetical protein
VTGGGTRRGDGLGGYRADSTCDHVLVRGMFRILLDGRTSGSLLWRHFGECCVVVDLKSQRAAESCRGQKQKSLWQKEQADRELVACCWADDVCVSSIWGGGGGQRVGAGNLSLIVDQNKNTRGVLHNTQTNSINNPQREV